MAGASLERVFTVLTTALLFLASLAAAVEPGQVEYVGGTAPGFREGAVGRLDMVAETALRFESKGAVLEIPYARIESFEYTREVTHHLGVVPAIAVGMARSRKHKHYFEIAFDKDATRQVVVFEVPKNLPSTLLAVLKNRAPEACKSSRPHCPKS